MVGEEFAWECECGNIEYSNVIPDECSKCLAIDSFTQLPEELMNEREKSSMDDDFDEPKVAKKSAKPKIKKPARKKRK